MSLKNLLAITGMLATCSIPLSGQAKDDITCPTLTVEDIENILKHPKSPYTNDGQTWKLHLDKHGKTTGSRYGVEVPLEGGFLPTFNAVLIVHKRKLKDGYCQYDVSNCPKDTKHCQRVMARLEMQAE